jgi:hypothetical protein
MPGVGFRAMEHVLRCKSARSVRATAAGRWTYGKSTAESVQAWFDAIDPGGVAFEYEVIGANE